MNNWSTATTKGPEPVEHYRAPDPARHIERPIAPCGIVDGEGHVFPGTHPARHTPPTWGTATPAPPRADLE